MAESTVLGYANKLRILARITDLSSPEGVKACICRMGSGASYREALTNAYDWYVKLNGLGWVKPVYKRAQRLPYVASREEISRIIARASRRYGLVFTLLSEAGLRPVELSDLTLRYVDLEKGSISAKSTKNGNPRILKLKPSTLEMFREYVAVGGYGLDTKLFPSPSATRHSFERYRNDLAKKLHLPELRKIRLYDLRHFYATMLYAKTRDILYVMQQLGHKRIENTLIYTHLIETHDLEYVCKAAKNEDQASALIESGFEYVCTSPEGTMIFRKLK